MGTRRIIAIYASLTLVNVLVCLLLLFARQRGLPLRPDLFPTSGPPTPSRTSVESQEKLVLDQMVAVTPRQIAIGAQTLEVEEAWIERVASYSDRLRILPGYWVCIRFDKPFEDSESDEMRFSLNGGDGVAASDSKMIYFWISDPSEHQHRIGFHRGGRELASLEVDISSN